MAPAVGMSDRGSGREFFPSRLVPLAGVIAHRGQDEVLAGLVGDSTLDDLGNGLESRTSTGLTAPGPADSAVAYVGLWGLSSVRTIHRVAERSASSGVWPRPWSYPTHAYLPVFVAPATPTHFAAILGSYPFDLAARQRLDDGRSSGESREDSWLKEQGVHGVVIFPIRRERSAGRSERQILTGELGIL